MIELLEIMALSMTMSVFSNTVSRRFRIGERFRAALELASWEVL